MSMFYWRDGWSFERSADDHILVWRKAKKAKDLPDLIMVIPSREWASIVSAVSSHQSQSVENTKDGAS